jgi:acetyltransferase-like isoleucine patch superfamily enzyme
MQEVILERERRPLIGKLNYFKRAYRELRAFDVNLPLFCAKSALYNLRGRQIFAHHNTRIRGVGNIYTEGRLLIGTGYVGLLNQYDRTFLRINGQLHIHGTVHLGKGTRFFIGQDAICHLSRCSFTGLSQISILHRLEIGSGTIISWGCEFLDDDFHTIEYPGRKDKQPGIIIGDHVWLGNGVKVLKGVEIASNIVVAAHSVVTQSCLEEHVLLAGNPAKIIKRDVTWQ